MGTWSAEIFGNDTSSEVKEYFYKQYNSGEQTSDIVSAIVQKYSFDIDNNDDDRYNILFSLAYCLWETASLDKERQEQTVEIIKRKKDIEVLKNLGADEKFLSLREKYTEKFLAKISTPKQTAKKRVKPPQQIESCYKNGSCLFFEYPNGKLGGIVVIDCEFYKNKGWMRFAMTDIEQEEKPDFNAFLDSHLTNFQWEIVFGQTQKFIAFENKTARIQTYELGYENNTERQAFFDYCQNFFNICGSLPKFTQCLKDTIGGSLDYQKKINDFSFDEFNVILKERLLFYRNNIGIHSQPLSNETLGKLKNLLVK